MTKNIENAGTDEIEIELSDETITDEDLVMEEPFNPNDISIITKQDALRNLVDRLTHDEIDLNTYFQRHADLWDPRKMSRLIESILIRFPLPAFYFDATNDEKWQVVDGLQRLSSIRKFIVEKNPTHVLRLKGLEYLTELEGKTYGDLPRNYQRRIDECPVTLFLIQPGTPDEVKYSIFRRINTGGLVLNNQEIRNAMTKPSLRIFLERLACDVYLKKTIGDQSKRMLDQELVLRFLAFYHMDYSKTSKNITTFLDKMMEELSSMGPKELNRLETTFQTTIIRCWDIFEETAFEKKTENSDSRRKRKNSSLFEVWTVALANLTNKEAQNLVVRKKQVQQKHLRLMTKDNEYFQSISLSTQKKDYWRTRHKKVRQLIKEVLNA